MFRMYSTEKYTILAFSLKKDVDSTFMRERIQYETYKLIKYLNFSNTKTADYLTLL